MNDISYYAIPGVGESKEPIPIKPFNAKDILKNTCEYFNIAIASLKVPDRSRKVVYPRQLAMYIMKKYTHLALKDIAAEFGTATTDHTTVISSVKTIRDLMEVKDELAIMDFNGIVTRINKNLINNN